MATEGHTEEPPKHNILFLTADSPGGVKYNACIQCYFPCLFSLPLKIRQFRDFEPEVVVVDLIALDRLLFHESSQRLWNPCAIVASQTTCGNGMSPRSCTSEQPFLAHLSYAFKISQSCLILFPQMLFRQGIPLIANKELFHVILTALL